MSAVCLNEWTAGQHMSPDPLLHRLNIGDQASVLGMEINLVILTYNSHFSASRVKERAYMSGQPSDKSTNTKCVIMYGLICC